MKKTVTAKLLQIVFAVAILSPDTLLAATVSYENAAKIAALILNKPDTNKNHLAPRVDYTSEAYYVFNGGGGFAVIAADDRLPMVLAYSHEVEIDPDDMSPSVAALLDAYSASVARFTDDVPQHSSWQKSGLAYSSGSASSKVLQTAKWGQGYPYNLSCPVYNGNQCVTGCGATALAIIMKYHHWPTAGRGSGSYNWKGETLTCDFSKPIEWSNMLDDYSGKSTSSQRKAVADLMYACGVTLWSNYDEYSTSSSFSSISRDIYCSFKYDMGANLIVLSEKEENEWIDIVRNEIYNGYPVLFAGKSSRGEAHAFVLDGIDSDGLFHVNWGWEGSSDGFYNFSKEAVDLGSVYGLDARIITNIRPGDDSEVEDLVIKDIVDGETLGLCTDVENIETGVPFRVNFPGVWNYGPEIEKPRYIFALCNGKGEIKEVLEEGEAHHPAPQQGLMSLSGSTLTVKGDVADEDCIQLFVSKGYDEPYKHVRAEGGIADRVPAKGNVVYRNPIFWDVENDITVTPSSSSCMEYSVFGFSSYFNVQYPQDKTVRHMYLNGQFLYAPWQINENGSFYIFVSSLRKNGSSTVKLCSYSESQLSHSCINITLNSTTRLKDIQFAQPYDYITKIAIMGEITEDDFLFLRSNFRNLRHLDLSQSLLQELPYKALEWTLTLEDIKLPEKLRYIGHDAFYVSGLKSVELPEGLEEIGLNAFNCCSRLEKVIAKNYFPLNISWCVFWGTPRETTGVLVVPIGYGSRYAAAPEWSLFSRIEEADIPVTTIKSNEMIDSEVLVDVYSIDGVHRYSGPYSDFTPRHGSGVYIARTNKGEVIKIVY